MDTRALPLSPPELLARSTILLCEADGALQAALQLMLEGVQRLLIVPTITRTCELLQEVQPDLLLIDIDGQADVLPSLRRLTSMSVTPKIVLIAAHVSLEFQEAAIRLGITSFQTKPWTPAHFIERVDTLLRGYALQPLRHIVKSAYKQGDCTDAVTSR